METTTSTHLSFLTGMPQFIKRGWGNIHSYLQTLLRRIRPVGGEDRPAGDPGPNPPENDADPTRTATAQEDEQANTTILDNVHLVGQFKTCAEGLKQICAATESDFLDLGSQLQTIYAESESLTQEVVAMLSSDQDQTLRGAMQTIQHHAADAIAELNHRRDKLAEDLDGLKAIQADLEALSKQNNSFKQVAKNLKMVGLNISIESARTDESKNMFQALAEEITQLAQTVYEVAANVSDDTASAQQNLTGIQADISVRMNNLQTLIVSADATVKDALVEVENMMQMLIHVMDGIGNKAKDINEQVGHLVMGIQIHDNITQRVAHIDTSIHEAVDIIDTSSGIDLPQSAMEVIYGKAYGINRLQMAQLKTISDDVNGVKQQSQTALDKIFQAVQEVAQPEGFDFSGAGNVNQFDVSNSRHPVVILRRALDQLIALFDEGLEDIRRLSAAREETSQTIMRMTEHIDRVRDINFDIRLKALNAVIKSTRLGETGKAIEAIVNEMKDMAEQSNTTIRSVTDIMESIASASDNMDENAAEDAKTADMAGQQLREGVEDFTASCMVFRDRSLKALGVGGELQEKISEARDRISFFEQLLNVFAHHHDDFTGIDSLLSPFAHAVPEDWLEEEKTIMDRYTMQREREAHEQILSGVRNSKNGVVEQTVAEDVDVDVSDENDSDLGDNIELF